MLTVYLEVSIICVQKVSFILLQLTQILPKTTKCLEFFLADQLVVSSFIENEEADCTLQTHLHSGHALPIQKQVQVGECHSNGQPSKMP